VTVTFWRGIAACRRDRLRLFATAYAQVIFVAFNTVAIARYELLANFLTAFMISLIWSWNVRRVAFGGMADRWFYAGGAAFGSVSGTVAAGWIL
jgi:hypothetical protein